MMSLYSLEVIKENNSNCRSCSLRKIDSPVVGFGELNSKLMILGEYPSPDESLVGRPFEERAGLLLKKILREANIDCDNTYMTYTVRCNASSMKIASNSIDSCKKWLWEELQIIKPKIIVTLGKMPTKLLLKPKSNFTLETMAGNSYKKDFLPNSLIVPWYSPSVMLQRGDWFSKQCVDFFKNIKKVMDV